MEHFAPQGQIAPFPAEHPTEISIRDRGFTANHSWHGDC